MSKTRIPKTLGITCGFSGEPTVIMIKGWRYFCASRTHPHQLNRIHLPDKDLLKIKKYLEIKAREKKGGEK